jgi:hypothetical protein
MTLFSLEDLGFGGAEERLGNDSEDDEADADPLRALLSQERVHLVADAIGHLPEREKLVIALYYNEDLTMKEVGGVLGLTESRVSQLHSQAMLRLKRYLTTKLATEEPEAGGRPRRDRDAMSIARLTTLVDAALVAAFVWLVRRADRSQDAGLAAQHAEGAPPRLRGHAGRRRTADGAQLDRAGDCAGDLRVLVQTSARGPTGLPPRRPPRIRPKSASCAISSCRSNGPPGRPRRVGVGFPDSRRGAPGGRRHGRRPERRSDRVLQP